MPKPATFTPAEISALADRLREGWRPGSQITPWLRDNAERLTKLNRDERFSWAAVASALNEVGIMYRTGDPWTTMNLAKAVSEVRAGERGNPTAERRTELAAWKAEGDATKAKEDAAFAIEWESMPREEQDELLDLGGNGRVNYSGRPPAVLYRDQATAGCCVETLNPIQLNYRLPLFRGSYGIKGSRVDDHPLRPNHRAGCETRRPSFIQGE